jgi:hypothetical protein
LSTEQTKTVSEWLRDMGEWTQDELREAALNLDGHSNMRVAAKKRLRAESDARLNSGKPAADEPFEQLVNRLEGMPQKAPDVVVITGPTLAVTTEQIFDRIDAYLNKDSQDTFDITAPRVESSPPPALPEPGHSEGSSAGRSNGQADSEESAV